MDQTLLQDALYELLQWATGNRESKQGNPYLKPSVQNGLKVLAKSCGYDHQNAWLDAKEIYETYRDQQ